MATTLKDIAEACNVSYSTVSKALKDSSLVKPETKKRIQIKAEELNYVPNHSARSLVSKKSGTIGLIWPALNRIAVNELIVEINNYLKNYNYVMLLSIDDPQTAAEKFLEYQCDGIIIFDEGEHTSLSKYIYENIPVIAYGAKNQLNYPIINPNHRKAMVMAIDFLISKGFNNIDYIGALNTNDSRQIIKENTFFNYCKNRNISYQLIDTVGLNSFDSEKEIKKFLNNKNLSEAIISGSFDITVGLLSAISPKHNIEIVSYDNIPQVNTLDYEITPVGVPTNIIAKNVVENLIKSIEGAIVENTILLEPEIKN